jgi:hypothetical protein
MPDRTASQDQVPSAPTASGASHQRDALLGLCVAALVVLILLFAGSTGEDRGFIYVDF